MGYVREDDTVICHSMIGWPATWTICGRWFSGSLIAAFTFALKRRT